MMLCEVGLVLLFASIMQQCAAAVAALESPKKLLFLESGVGVLQAMPSIFMEQEGLALVGSSCPARNVQSTGWPESSVPFWH